MSTVTMGLFRSFFMGSYEYTDTHGSEAPQLLDEDEYYKRIREDYKLLAGTGIKTVREGVRWGTVEKETGVYDFREIKFRMEVASEVGVQQLWDLCHFGFPPGLTPNHSSFVERFTTFCTAFAKFYRQQTFEPLIITPMNEISSMAAKASRASKLFNIGKPANDLKYYLCKAAIAGIEAIREADPNARIMLTEPLARIDAENTPVVEEEMLNENQFSVMDIISGRRNPELGGKPEYLDILAFNYYYTKEAGKLRDSLPVEKRTRKFIRLSEMLNKAFDRYKCPVVVSETGQFDEGRAAWITEVMDECLEAMHHGVDLQGICIYPITEIADQIANNNPAVNAEKWKLNKENNRISNNKPYVAALQQCQEKLSFEKGYLKEQASRYAFSFNG